METTAKTTADLMRDRATYSAMVTTKGWEWARFALMSVDAELARRGVTA